MNLSAIISVLAAEQSSPASLAMTFIPLVLVIVFFYFFIIRPQKKQDKKDAEMRDNLEIGDEVVTNGGIVGIVRGTQMRETVEFLYENGAKEVHMRSACPPIMYGCKYLNFSRSTSELELIARQIIDENEGIEGVKYIEEYSDSSTDQFDHSLVANSKKACYTICEKKPWDC